MSRSGLIFTDFMKDVEEHIESRISGLPKHEVQEISAYIANRAIVMTNDVLHDSYRVSKNEAVSRLRKNIAERHQEVNE